MLQPVSPSQVRPRAGGTRGQPRQQGGHHQRLTRRSHRLLVLRRDSRKADGGEG